MVKGNSSSGPSVERKVCLYGKVLHGYCFNNMPGCPAGQQELPLVLVDVKGVIAREPFEHDYIPVPFRAPGPKESSERVMS